MENVKYTESDVSLVIPARKNLVYAKWGYEAIRAVSKDIWICYADDASCDDTWEWMESRMKLDPRVKALKHPGEIRAGHTLLYDKIIYDLVETPIAMIYHCDMFCFENTFKNCLKHMKPRTIVSATRIEPPLHPSGKEKHIFDMGLEPDEFKEHDVKELVKKLEVEHKDETTEGIFAPWMFFVDDFKKVGGHDECFAPQSKEDSCLFNRFVLDGVNVIQARDSFVAHLTCRGSRRNPTLTDVKTDSSEWLEHNMRSTRNFIRKWGSMVRHTELMKPIIPHKYNIGLVLEWSEQLESPPDDIMRQLISMLEPFVSTLYFTWGGQTEKLISEYISLEQDNTKFDLSKRLKIATESDNDISLTIRLDKLVSNFQLNYQFIQQLPDVLADSGEIGELQYGDFDIKIKSLNTYEHELIKVENTGWRRKNHK